MGRVRVSEDIVPVIEFKAQAAEWLRRLADDDGHPLIITQNGKPAAVMVSPKEFDRLTEHQRLLTAVHQGMEDEKEGRVHSSEEVFRHLRERIGNMRNK